MLFTFYCFSFKNVFRLVFVSFYLYSYTSLTATKDSRFLSRCSFTQARVKTLATVLASALSPFGFAPRAPVKETSLP